MDSLTQATLGAAVSYACWHRQLGRRSLVWGAGLGTLPDLDVLLYPILNDIQRLYWHRGESHSLFFSVFGGLLIGWLLWKHRWRGNLTHQRTSVGVILVLVTHVALDYSTTYGTQLVAPFSRYGFAHGNLFIIDPLYTLPMLIGIVSAGVMKGKSGWRANTAGIVFSCLYLIFSYISHAYADHTFKRHLADQNVEVLESFTGATPMNTLLWRHLARTPDGILIGYFSIIADSPQKPIRFDRVSRNEHLIAPYRNQRNVKAVEWFSKGFWVARNEKNMLTLSDLRFGELRFREKDTPERWQYLFAWKITGDQDTLAQQPWAAGNIGAALSSLWTRITRPSGEELPP